MVSRFFVASVLSFLPLLYALRSADLTGNLEKQIFQDDRIQAVPPVLQKERPGGVGEANLVLVQTYELDSSEVPLMASIHRHEGTASEGDVLRLWFGTENQHTLAKTLTAGWEGFQKPIVFSTRGERFVYVATQPVGSGGFVEETVLWIAPDYSLQEVDFYPAADLLEDKVGADEFILSGGANQFRPNGNPSFEFDVAHKGDPHCCPAAGRIRGNYRVMGGSSFDEQAMEYHQNFPSVEAQASNR